MLYHSLCLTVFKVSGSVAMATRNQNKNGAYTRNGHVKIAREVGLCTRHQLISVSPRYTFCVEYGSVSHIASSFV